MNQLQAKKAIEKTIDKYIEDIEKSLFKEFKAAQAETLNIIKGYYGKYLAGVDSADYYNTLNLYNRMKSMDKEIKAIYVKLNKNMYKTVYNGQSIIFEESYLRNKYIAAYFTSARYQAPNNLIKEISITGDVDLIKKIKDKELKKQAQGYISKSGVTLSSLISDNNATSLAKVYRVLKQGLISGQSYTKQAQAIKKEFGSNYNKALKVVRTEGNRNASAGAFANSQDLASQGITVKRKWLATLDSRTRDTHARLDGKFEDKNGLFWIGSDSAKYPGDFSDVANNVNCRCSVIDIINNQEPTLRRGINPVTGKSDILSFQDYDEWRNG